MKKSDGAPSKYVSLGTRPVKGTRSGSSVGAVLKENMPSVSVSRGTLGEFLERYRLSHDAITRMTGFSQRAVTNWNQGAKPSASTLKRLIEMKRLFAALERLVTPDAIGEWLKEPNPAFDGSTPLQVIERGESDRIWRMVYELESGEPT